MLLWHIKFLMRSFLIRCASVLMRSALFPISHWLEGDPHENDRSKPQLIARIVPMRSASFPIHCASVLVRSASSPILRQREHNLAQKHCNGKPQQIRLLFRCDPYRSLCAEPAPSLPSLSHGSVPEGFRRDPVRSGAAGKGTSKSKSKVVLIASKTFLDDFCHTNRLAQARRNGPPGRATDTHHPHCPRGSVAGGF